MPSSWGGGGRCQVSVCYVLREREEKRANKVLFQWVERRERTVHEGRLAGEEKVESTRINQLKWKKANVFQRTGVILLATSKDCTSQFTLALQLSKSKRFLLLFFFLILTLGWQIYFKSFITTLVLFWRAYTCLKEGKCIIHNSFSCILHYFLW